MYDRAAALAGFGVWECDLATNALCWSDGVYDLFEIERGSIVDRRTTVAMYDPESREAMERLRAHAIATRSGFTLDARICTRRGRDRWIRLTAGIDCEQGVPVRIFGTKQDITEETRLWTQMRRMAEQDPLTGLANRGMFQSAFDGDARRPLGALLLIDLDGFKQINDRHGHAAGDACLSRTAERLCHAWPTARLVARLGGDEFAVLIDAPSDAPAIDHGIRTTIAAIARPIPWRDIVLQVGGSIGVAMPDDPTRFDASTVFAQADAALYAAKAAGKGTARVHGGGIVQPLPVLATATAVGAGLWTDRPTAPDR
ncbi:diguanylate cyclase [Sphingomonas sp. PB2P19]|uniref:diguanylate cyclase domain-containing protein n=1 Tax=Sphingomonas rhamnosi TaxID=3096156 RepID=UPI002FC8D003